ncbi:hypothetical protein [Serratia rhizosphaerae]|nr:hypothetical protein [Serratia rhizosphaerae]
MEQASAENSIQQLAPQTNKKAYNTTMALTGILVIVPWFFMDLGNAEQTEIDAYQRRIDALSRLSSEKGCKVVNGVMQSG